MCAKACKECGAPLAPPRRTFCSTPCYRKDQNRRTDLRRQRLKRMRREAAAAAPPKPCVVCGSPVPTRKFNVKYCSDLCRAEGLRITQDRQRVRRQAERTLRGLTDGELANGLA